MARDANDVSRTWDRLVESEQRRRRALATIDDPRRPKTKSPVHVTIIWDDDDPVEPGRPVKLGAAAFDPDAVPSAPYSGLTFHADLLSALDTTRAIAITTERIPGGGSGVGQAIIPQAYWAKVNVTNAAHTFAKVITGGTIFDSDAAATYPILWKQSGTGEKWAIVLLQAASTTSVEPPLRRFNLTATKTLLQNTAQARFLDDAGNVFGAVETLHDPEQRFSGRPASYLPGESGFKGVALQRRDLAGVEADRWEIVNMEAMASWAVVECYTVVPVALFTLKAYGGGNWDYRAPGVIDAAIAVAIPTDMVSQLASGRRFYARLSAADTSPPTYVLAAVRQGGASTGGGLITVYIDHDIPAATEVGLASFDPEITTVELYERNETNGRYGRGVNVEIENHDVKISVEASTSKPKRGMATLNTYGRYVLHVETCVAISEAN